jgi:hypothetical protein
MTDLSPAAAVLDAVCKNTEPDCDTQHLIAAALRAAADQLREAYANEEYVDSADDWLDGVAAEVEGH